MPGKSEWAPASASSPAATPGMPRAVGGGSPGASGAPRALSPSWVPRHALRPEADLSGEGDGAGNYNSRHAAGMGGGKLRLAVLIAAEDAGRARTNCTGRSFKIAISRRLIAILLFRILVSAGMLAACRGPCLISSRARHLQSAASPGRWEQAFRRRPALQLCGWPSPAVRVVLPRWLGVLAPSQQAREQNVPERARDFKLIYRFPGIKYCRALSRMKLLQTAFTGLILPPAWFLCWQNQMSQAQCLYSTGIACFAGVMLYAMSYYFRRIIGMMYLNEDGTMLRVAHLTFWGRRNDIYCPVETVMTLTDVGDDQNELLLRFKQYGEDRFLYFTLRFGQVVDKEGFTKVFGKI
uniref:transmembrane protein 186 n=1 Tax=Euleptes europaea TaxID=460621 RepID=UPI00253FC91E|nr:transmembrane protein 186 [Euleptes europaea]